MTEFDEAPAWKLAVVLVVLVAAILICAPFSAIAVARERWAR